MRRLGCSEAFVRCWLEGYRDEDEVREVFGDMRRLDWCGEEVRQVWGRLGSAGQV